MKKITVYCSSATGLPDDLTETAHALGRTIGEEGCALVYGGVNAGLMHDVAAGASAAGAQVIGIVPEMFLHRADPLCTTVIETPDLNTRKSRMIAEADIFVVLPGGVGTIDEWVSTVSHFMASGTIGVSAQPIIVYNREGLFENMAAQLAETNASIFSRGRMANPGIIVSAKEELLEALRKEIKKMI